LQILFAIVRAIVKPEPTSSPAASAIDTVARRPERPIAWSVDDSAELYQVNAWGKGYFCVNPAGHLVVRPYMNADREIDLFDVVQGLK
jgi:arginine decarboxylase